MPVGYELMYTAAIEAPYWDFDLSKSPLTNPPIGVLSRGSRICLQRPADARSMLGTHQSAYLEGVGQVVMRVTDFKAVTSTR